jgi:DNA-binding response OmpR family regulator
MTQRILVVDDDTAIRDVVSYTFAHEGFEVESTGDGAAALELLDESTFDLVILDLMLPHVSGIDVCRKLREKGDTTPIVMLTAKDSELDLVVGLEVGADDYVPKPFSRAELVSRVRALLRRREYDRETAAGPVYAVGGIRVDMVRRLVEVDGSPVHLTPAEFKLLSLLAERANEVVTRRELMEHLWDSDWVGDTRACDVHIWNIRRKVERDPGNPQRLVTVRGVGFTMREDGLPSS